MAGRTVKDEFLLGAMTFLNWLWDTSVYLYSETGKRCGRGWAAFVKEEEIWHIFENGAAYPFETAEGDQPQWIYNATRNQLINNCGGLMDPAAFRHCEYIGGGIKRGPTEIYDITDFLTAVRIHGCGSTEQPPVRVLLWAWAAWTGRKEVGWLASQREAYSVVLMNQEADEVVHEVAST